MPGPGAHNSLSTYGRPVANNFSEKNLFICCRQVTDYQTLSDTGLPDDVTVLINCGQLLHAKAINLLYRIYCKPLVHEQLFMTIHHHRPSRFSKSYNLVDKLNLYKL